MAEDLHDHWGSSFGPYQRGLSIPRPRARSNSVGRVLTVYLTGQTQLSGDETGSGQSRPSRIPQSMSGSDPGAQQHLAKSRGRLRRRLSQLIGVKTIADDGGHATEQQESENPVIVAYAQGYQDGWDAALLDRRDSTAASDVGDSAAGAASADVSSHDEELGRAEIPRASDGLEQNSHTSPRLPSAPQDTTGLDPGLEPYLANVDRDWMSSPGRRGVAEIQRAYDQIWQSWRSPTTPNSKAN